MRRYQAPDILKAVLVSAAIVVVAAVIVWMLRPGPAGIPASGGIINRQPRASWLIVGAVIAGLIACWVILRGNGRARKRAKVILPVALVVVLLGTIGLGVAWPGGLLRHEVAPVFEPEPEPEPEPTTTKPSITPSTEPGATGSTATTGPPTTPPR